MNYVTWFWSRAVCLSLDSVTRSSHIWIEWSSAVDNTSINLKYFIRSVCTERIFDGLMSTWDKNFCSIKSMLRRFRVLKKKWRKKLIFTNLQGLSLTLILTYLDYVKRYQKKRCYLIGYKSLPEIVPLTRKVGCQKFLHYISI